MAIRELFCEGIHQQEAVPPGAGRYPKVQTSSAALGTAAGYGVGSPAAWTTLTGCPFPDQFVRAEVSASAQQGLGCA